MPVYVLLLFDRDGAVIGADTLSVGDLAAANAMAAEQLDANTVATRFELWADGELAGAGGHDTPP